MKKLLVILILIVMSFSLSVEADSTKAYKDINFGESEKEVYEKLDNNENLDFNNFHITTISGTEYRILPAFYKDRLYEISFISNFYTADSFDATIKEERDILVRLIENQYGEPPATQTLEFFDINEGYISWSHAWTEEFAEENKIIKIGIGMTDSWKYYSVLNISYKPIIEEIEENKNKDINDKSKDF